MRDQKKSQLVIIFLTVFIYLAGFGMIIPIIPALGRDFGATPLEVGLLMSIYSFMQFLFSPFWGKISDRVGRRPILLICLLGEGLSYILFAAARSLEVLFLARLAAGFFGASISTASAYISDITPAHERSKGMALIGAAFGLGFIVGPALGGLLSMWGEHISSEPFFGTSFAALWVGGICFLGFLFALKFLKESLAHTHEVKPQDLGRIQKILNYIKKPLIGQLICVIFLATTGMAMMEATLVLFVGERFQWGLREVSFGFAYIGVISTIGQGFIVRRLLPIYGERRILAMGLLFMGVSLVGMAFSYSIPGMGIMVSLLAIGNSFTNSPALGSISLLSDAREQGAVLGTAQGMSSLGRIVGPALGGFVYGIHMMAPLICGGILTLGGMSLVLSIFSRLPQTAKRSSSSSHG